jgi:hypothetical protein
MNHAPYKTQLVRKARSRNIGIVTQVHETTVAVNWPGGSTTVEDTSTLIDCINDKLGKA